MWQFFALVFLVTAHCTLSQETDECKCVNYYWCNPTTRTIIQDGRGIIGTFGERFGGKNDNDNNNICNCACPDDKICCRLVNGTKTPAPPTTCGVRNPDGLGFKSGTDSVEAKSDQILLGEFPWFVDILDSGGAHRCAGTLIHPSVVLTSAHCVVRKKTFIVRGGDYDNLETNEVLKHQDIRVSTIKIHEEYNPAVFYNDIALLFLNGSFDFNKSAHIQPACLAPADATFGTERCYVIGRGKDQNDQYQHIPRKVDLPLMDKNTCQTKLRQTKLTQSFNLHRSFLCAGGEKGKDSCLGDGGGPLVCPIANEEDKFQQVGIVSWGIGCHQDMPGVYTNVQFLRDWIDKEMKRNNFDINHYIYSAS